MATGWRKIGYGRGSQAEGRGYSKEFGEVEGEKHWAATIERRQGFLESTIWVLKVWNADRYAISTYPTLAAAKEDAMPLIYTARRGWHGR